MSTHFQVSGTGVSGPLPRRSGNYKWWVLVTAIFGAFVSILDSTIVNTALPHIQQAFGADLHVASYVSTAYILAQGVVIAASGFLANRFGIKRIYLLSLTLFTLGSALCGLAWNIDILILFRIFQGAAGAPLFPLSLSLIFGAFPEDQRGLANGVFGIPVLVAPALGPVLGGYLAEYVDWRWIFYVNVPIGIIGIIICWRMLQESELQSTLPFDLRGFLLVASGRCSHGTWWRIRHAFVNAVRAGFLLIRRDQGGYLILPAHALVTAFTSTKPPLATSLGVFSCP